MKIETKIGNLLDVTSGHIVHGCNAQGVMGSGVALAVKKTYPSVYQEYRTQFEEYGLRLGDAQPVLIGPELVVWNAVTQNLYGKSGERFVSYDAVEECFRFIDNQITAWDLFKSGPDDIWPEKHIHIPLIGAGLGGGNWEIIREIIEQTVTHPTTLWILP